MKAAMIKSRSSAIFTILISLLFILPGGANSQGKILVEIDFSSDWGIIDLFADWFAGGFKASTATISSSATLKTFDMTYRRIEIIKATQRNSQSVKINIDFEYPSGAQKLYLGTVKGSTGQIRVRIYNSAGQLIHDFVDNRNALSSIYDYMEFNFSPPTTINSSAKNNLPESAILDQNYPNPFNPQTRIEYTVVEANEVILQIYNQLGQKIRTLVNEIKAPGKYTSIWDGRDEYGNPVASGAYLYQLQIGDKIQAKKMIKLK